jgi:hypothetical protein
VTVAHGEKSAANPVSAAIAVVAAATSCSESTHPANPVPAASAQRSSNRRTPGFAAPVPSSVRSRRRDAEFSAGGGCSLRRDLGEFCFDGGFGLCSDGVAHGSPWGMC